MSNPVPVVALNDGNVIPQLGFGVWQVPNDEVTEVVLAAIAAGYRSIDTAQGYDNEDGVGEAIKRAGVGRAELFITSKLRTKDLGYDAALKSFDGTLRRLGLETLDLFLIHWPAPAHDRYAEAWRAFVKLQEEGRVKSIGVSNFLPEHLERIIGESGVAPAVNQIELHPYYQQRAVREVHAQRQIAIECYSPLGHGSVLEDETIAGIARKHGRTPGQVILRWHVQQGLIVIPKTVTPARMAENFDIFGFELDAADLQAIEGLDRPDGKTGSDPATNNDLF